MDIGDIRKIYQVDNHNNSVVVGSWEFKALAQYQYVYGTADWCESASWDLSENPYTVEPKLNMYLWGEFCQDSEIWE